MPRAHALSTAVALAIILAAGMARAQDSVLSVRAGAVFFSHSRADADPSSQISRVSDGAGLLDAATLDLGSAPGFDIELIRRFAANLDLELRYFGDDAWHVWQTASDPGSVQFTGFGTTATAGSQRLDYSSRLYNLEANLRWWLADWMPLLVGFRTLQLHEQFELSGVDGAPAATVIDCRTSNYLYGLQAGAEPIFVGMGWFRLDGLLKIGAYGNAASENSVFPTLGGDLQQRAAGTSLVAELGLIAGLRFSSHMILHGGYEWLWVTDVALAPDQSRSNNLVERTAAVDLRSTAFFQGAVANLEFAF